MMGMNFFNASEQRRRNVIAQLEARREAARKSPLQRSTEAAHARRKTWALRLSALLIALAALWLAAKVHAAGFEVAASPARFELSAKNASRVGQSIDIYNLGAAETEVSVRTIDWTYSEDGKLSYHDELLPGSCRHWVAVERKTVKIAGRSKKSFRFQIEPPLDAARGQCRFMLAIEGVDPAHRALIAGGGANLSLPVNGRIAVPVYFSVNGAEPKLELTEVKMASVAGKYGPAVLVRNSGDAHGRLDGGLEATDAKGTEFELVPDGTPILPGQTRLIALTPKAEGKGGVPEMHYPVTTKGSLDWDRGSFKVVAEFRR